MAWSYRQDLSDEIYHNQVGVAQVEGKKLPATPRSAEHAEELLKGEKEKPKKDARITEHQEHVGQNVPRMVEPSEEEKKAQEEKDKDKGRLLVPDPNEVPRGTENAKLQQANADRDRIRAEEQAKVAADEREKELDKIRKEEQDKLKKESHPTPANKK